LDNDDLVIIPPYHTTWPVRLIIVNKLEKCRNSKRTCDSQARSIVGNAADRTINDAAAVNADLGEP
jgi:hypothetical protein